MIRTLAVALIALALPFTAGAQAPKPGEDGAAPCAVISGPFGFCGAAPEFNLTPQADNTEVTAYYTTPEGIQVAVIIEPLGTAQGLTIDGLQQSVLSILSSASGTPVADIPVLERATLIVDGIPRPNFVYRGAVEGVNYVYSNTIVLLEETVAQFVTIDANTMVMSATHRDLHTRLLANAQVNR